MHRSLAATVATFAAMAALSAGSTAPLAATVATFAAMAALSAGSTAPMAQAVTCEGQLAICLKTCTHFACKRKCNGPYQFCLYSKKETYKPGGAGATQND